MRSLTAVGYLRAMAAYWLIFGLITTFYPALMDLFQTTEGIAAKTAFSDHVWMHGGLDILSVSILVFALSLAPASISALMLRAAGLAALMPAIAIAISLLATPYWNPLFVVAGLGCLAFAVGGVVLAGRTSGRPTASVASPAA
jgi:hypothetical protein